MQWFVIVLLSLAAVDARRAERLQLEGTHVSVAVPSGFVRHEGLVSDRPSITFNLPPDRNGVQTMHPELSLSLAPTNIVEAYVADFEARPGEDWLIKPRTLEIAHASAWEFARNGPMTMHLSAGGVIERTVTGHVIILSLGEQRYQCDLSTSPESYSLYAPQLYEFCGSVQVSD